MYMGTELALNFTPVKVTLSVSSPGLKFLWCQEPLVCRRLSPAQWLFILKFLGYSFAFCSRQWTSWSPCLTPGMIPVPSPRVEIFFLFHFLRYNRINQCPKGHTTLFPHKLRWIFLFHTREMGWRSRHRFLPLSQLHLPSSTVCHWGASENCFSCEQLMEFTEKMPVRDSSLRGFTANAHLSPIMRTQLLLSIKSALTCALPAGSVFPWSLTESVALKSQQYSEFRDNGELAVCPALFHSKIGSNTVSSFLYLWVKKYFFAFLTSKNFGPGSFLYYPGQVLIISQFPFNTT